MQLNQLIKDCIAGNRLSQNELYQLLAPKMFAVCLRYAKNREEAEEILQEGFVQLFRSLKNFHHAGSFEGWARRIMVNCAIQHFRSLPKIYLVSMDRTTEQVGSQEDVTAQLDKKELLKMIQDLPDAYRMVFNLYVFEGLKHREIAHLLGITEGTSKSNLFDAKQMLQRAVARSLKVAKQN